MPKAKKTEHEIDPNVHTRGFPPEKSSCLWNMLPKSLKYFQKSMVQNLCETLRNDLDQQNEYHQKKDNKPTASKDLNHISHASNFKKK